MGAAAEHESLEDRDPLGATVRALWALRVGAALCFIGHGESGLASPEAWRALAAPLTAPLGIDDESARVLLSVVGTVDILLGASVLFGAPRAVLVYMAGWAFFTALLRPIGGLSVFEAVVRAGNVGVPLALLLLTARVPPGGSRLSPLAGPAGDMQRRRTVLALRFTTALLFLGHAGLSLTLGDAALATHGATRGLVGLLGVDGVRGAGLLEAALAAAVALRPSARLAWVVFAWKGGVELSHAMVTWPTLAPLVTLVARAAGIAAPLALALLLPPRPTRRR